MKYKHRAIAILLSIVMMLAYMPALAFAEDGEGEPAVTEAVEQALPAEEPAAEEEVAAKDAADTPDVALSDEAVSVDEAVPVEEEKLSEGQLLMQLLQQR